MDVQAMRRSFADKCSFTAVWIRATAIGRITWTPKLGPRVKSLLIRLPTVRRYLAEKHSLAAALTQAITERDQLQAALRAKHAELEDIVVERRSLLTARNVLQAEVAAQRATLERLTTEREEARARPSTYRLNSFYRRAVGP